MFGEIHKNIVWAFANVWRNTQEYCGPLLMFGEIHKNIVGAFANVWRNT